MKRFQKVLSVFLIILMICGLAVPAAAEKTGEKTSVSEAQTEKVAAQKITISGSKNVAKGKKVTLKATVSPAGASQKVVWTSSNKKIATVSSKGVVKGIKAGKVKITATSKTNPKVKATWKMTVTSKPVRKITIKAPMSTMNLRGTRQMTLEAVIAPSGAAKTVVWKSSQPSVAKVSAKGVVTALSKGRTEITATATDGSGVKGKITIKVTDSSKPVEPENPKPHEIYVTTHQGNTVTFFMYYPELRNAYALNSAKNTVDTIEFRLGFTVKGPKAAYTVETWHAKTGENPVKLPVSKMKHNIYYNNQEEQSFDPVGTAKFKVKGKNLSWTVTFPSGFDLTKARIIGSFFNLMTDEWKIDEWKMNKPLF